MERVFSGYGAGMEQARISWRSASGVLPQMEPPKIGATHGKSGEARILANWQVICNQLLASGLQVKMLPTRFFGFKNG
jgi:hypothetical protein